MSEKPGDFFLVPGDEIHAPVAYLNAGSPEYFAAMSLGLLALTGVFLVQLFAQRSLYPDWLKRMGYFPMLIAGSMGLALNNTTAILGGLSGRVSPFVRTPNFETFRL